jgi:phosphoglycolate phosphatase
MVVTQTNMQIEVITGASARNAKIALLDFDGTLSLVRAGWMDVMTPMMLGELRGLQPDETEADLTATVHEFVYRLTGKPTIEQMIELSRQIERRGGKPQDPLEYKERYLRLLNAITGKRLAELRRDPHAAGKYLVPGSLQLLQDLRARGLKLYLASGTDHESVCEESKLLGITPFFDGGIFGAVDDRGTFSKKKLIDKLIGSSECAGPEILGFGDGYVEIENVKSVGGIAVGVATDEPECRRIDPWKRNRLVQVGADYIIPHYLQRDELFQHLFAV